jgi:hypothetical protein
LAFLDHNDRIPAKVLGVILTVAYMVFRGKSILKTALAWKKAASKLLQSTVSPTFYIFIKKNVLTVLCNNLDAATFQASAVFKMDFPLKTI